MTVHGNLAGLRASQIQNLERLYQRRLPAEQLLTPELARELAERSFEIKRQIGLIIDRFGAIRHVIVGDDRQIVTAESQDVAIQHRHDLVAARHREGPTGQKIILHIHDDECVAPLDCRDRMH